MGEIPASPKVVLVYEMEKEGFLSSAGRLSRVMASHAPPRGWQESMGENICESFCKKFLFSIDRKKISLYNIAIPSLLSSVSHVMMERTCFYGKRRP
jgi:hypothetical protein